VSPSRCALIATGPHGFPGAGQIMSQTLREFAEDGHDVTYVGAQRPFMFNFLEAEGVKFSILPASQGGVIREDGAIRSSDVLLVTRLAEAMVLCAKSAAAPDKAVVFWASYLFPYGLAALLASSSLLQEGHSPALWLTPTGSDVWEIGPQLQRITEWLLNSPLVSAITAYTEPFSREIAERYSVTRPITTIPPGLDWRRFAALDATARATARDRLAVPSDTFVLSSHSNMRPVKRPEDVIMIANAVASRVQRRVLLLMLGPLRDDLAAGAGRGPCQVRWLGVRERVEEVIVAADVELNCSTHDSYNLSLAEAMACGLPVVSTDVVGIGPEIRSAQAGYLFSVEAPDTSATARQQYQGAVDYLVGMCENDDQRAIVGARARQYALATFRARRTAASFRTLL